MTEKEEKIKQGFNEFISKLKEMKGIEIKKEAESLLFIAYTMGYDRGENDTTGNVALMK